MSRGSAKRPPVPFEDDEQKALVQWLTIRGVMFFAVPNESGRSNAWARASWRKSMGVRSGAPDLVIIDRAAGPHCRPVAVEMKRQRGSKTSDAQLQMHADMRARGWLVIVAKGANDAIEQLAAAGVTRVRKKHE